MRVANARMYAVNPAVGALWRRVFAWVGERARVPLDVVDHRGPLAELWHRDDIAAALMCGYPLASWRGASPPVPIAAPAPAPHGDAVYQTDIVVRADAPFERDDDLADARFGWTVVDSQSGYQAPRRHFAARAIARGGRFFASTVGPLVTPRGVVDALLADAIDAGPLDAHWHALLRRHEPATAARLRVVATTPPTPIPAFVAADATPSATRDALVEAFEEAGHARALRGTLDALLVRRFCRIDAAAYATLAAQAREIDALGYHELR
jgi:ABC-type phosphate/phosphonate transport system substrate-binding protein